jgi:parallel beta-helix repeat protein
MRCIGRRLACRGVAGAGAVSVALLVSTLAGLGVDDGQAWAAQVGCGATITTDTTLHHDLVDCPNNGIVIGADDITLDLNGHTIDSDGTRAAGCDPEIDFCDVGVASDGNRGVAVVGGKLQEFDFGVFVFAGRGIGLRQLRVSRSLDSGIVLGDTTRSQLRGDSVFANGLTTDQAGVVLFGSHDNRIEGNTVSHSGDIGLFAIDSADRNTIEHNTFSDNPEAAVLIGDGNGNLVGRNRARATADVIVSGNRNTIVRNRLFHSHAGPDGGGFGVSLEGGHDNRVARNFVVRADVAGIRLADFVTEGGPPTLDNIVRRDRRR